MSKAAGTLSISVPSKRDFRQDMGTSRVWCVLDPTCSNQFYRPHLLQVTSIYVQFRADSMGLPEYSMSSLHFRAILEKKNMNQGNNRIAWNKTNRFGGGGSLESTPASPQQNGDCVFPAISEPVRWFVGFFRLLTLRLTKRRYVYV